MAQLIINRSDSRCGSCGKSASMYEAGHYTILGYTENGQPGCLEEWDSVSSDYIQIPEILAESDEGYFFAEHLRGLPVYDCKPEPIGYYGGTPRET